MDFASSRGSSLVLSPLSCQTVRELLRIKAVAWSQETGLPASVHVIVKDKIFNLHKHPLCSKSGYFRRILKESLDFELPDNFPGGSETFEMIALFSYTSSLPIDPFNVTALRCASEFLEMTEDYSSGNLIERSDLYLNQVVLQSWNDTVIVLQKCQSLLPWAEDLLIVSRCVESLAFMACMEILDPEQRRDWPVITLQALAGQPWNCDKVKEIARQELWIKDLTALPFGFFKRIIGSLRRQGMKEKYVSPLIAFYANKWVLSKKTHQFWENMGDHNEQQDVVSMVSLILQGIIELLPQGEKASRVIPVGFYLALLSNALNLGLSAASKNKLKDNVTSLLHFAQVDDFLLPANDKESIASSIELLTMEKIVSSSVLSNSEKGRTPSVNNSVVAELWDGYLSKIAVDSKIGPKRFTELIEIVQMSDRQTHDHLYKAMSIFLFAHPQISQEEKASVCKYLNCQKLSQDTCIQAVQNELMPLRMIVQALFVQQLNTHQAFKDYSDSFRFAQFSDNSGSLSGSGCQNPKSQQMAESPYKRDGAESASGTLSFLQEKDLNLQRKEDYESTSFRIQSLEQELVSLKKNLQWQHISKGPEQKTAQSFRLLEKRSLRKKAKPVPQVTTCIGSVNWASQRKYASRLLKIFQRLTMFSSSKSKRKQVDSGFSQGTSPCRKIQHLHDTYDH
ncbi:BTB/POZ domain-containing protein At5g48130 [Aristolochia californica]|uniref:BTB/POZ domain-containing protein At5g48130 n=1 Tax=Aristolochia californica TaxID=171875 RepID=UPI0035D8F39B